MALSKVSLEQIIKAVDDLTVEYLSEAAASNLLAEGERGKLSNHQNIANLAALIVDTVPDRHKDDPMAFTRMGLAVGFYLGICSLVKVEAESQGVGDGNSD